MKAYERILNRAKYSSPLFKVQKPDSSTTVVCSDDCYDPTDPRLLYEVVEESIPFGFTLASSTPERTQG